MSDLKMDPAATVLLAGVVGSQAYGMATPESDEDRLGIVLMPTQSLIGLAVRKETWTSTDPDVNRQVHESCVEGESDDPRPALAGHIRGHPPRRATTRRRPLAVPRHEDGAQCVRWLRDGSGPGVAAAWRFVLIGYKEPDCQACPPLLSIDAAGGELLRTGTMSLRVPDRESLFALGASSVAEIVAHFEEAFARFQAAPSVLPDLPDVDAANTLLWGIREEFGR